MADGAHLPEHGLGLLQVEVSCCNREMWSGLDQRAGHPRAGRFPCSHAEAGSSPISPQLNPRSPHMQKLNRRTSAGGFWNTTAPEEQVKDQDRWVKPYNVRDKRILP